MRNYTFYKSEFDDYYIVELCDRDSSSLEMLNVQKMLTKDGYLIVEIINNYLLKCVKVGEDEK